jgi:hypothetical protein
LQRLPYSLEGLSPARFRKRFGAAEGATLPECLQGTISLLRRAQISTLESGAELLEIGAARLVEALQLLKYR